MKSLNISSDIKLPIEAVTQTFAVLAKRGVGKSYLAAVMTEEMLGAGLHVVIADPVGVFWGLRAAANGKDPGLPIIVMGGDHGDVPLEASAGKVVAEFVVDTRSSVVLDLSLLRKGDQVRFMTDFAETLYHRNRAPLHLVLDEADAFAPQRPLHGQERMLGAIQDLVRRGRARGIGVTLVTQRAAVLSKDVLTQVEVLVALRTIAPQDRDAIEAWIQAHDAHGQRAEFMASLASLPIGTAWFWSPGWLDVFQRVKVRARETFDSSATPKVGSKPPDPKKLAAVDLEALKGRIAATIEKAKAEDPRELKRQNAELKAQLAKVPTVPTAKEKRVEVKVAVFKEQHVRRLEVTQKKIAADLALIDRISERLSGARSVLEASEAIGRRLEEARRPATHNMSHGLPGAGNAAIRLPVPLKHSPAAPPRPTSAHQVAGGVAQRILNALAELEQLGAKRPARELVAFLAGYSHLASKGFVNAVSSLRTEGLIEYPDSDSCVLTEEGRGRAEPPARPRSPEELQARVIEMLGGASGRILAPLIRVYPNPMARTDVAAEAGYGHLASKGFVNAVSRLRTLGFIDYPDTRSMVAMPVLFLEG